MKDHRHSALTRRSVLRRFAALIGAAALPTLGLPWLVRAAEYGTVRKSAVSYQDHPNGSEFCAKCINFIPGSSPDAPGYCRLVAGTISPRGWCVAYAAG